MRVLTQEEMLDVSGGCGRRSSHHGGCGSKPRNCDPKPPCTPDPVPTPPVDSNVP